MGIYLLNIHRNPNVGIYARATEKFVILPNDLNERKLSIFREILGVSTVPAMVGGTRLIGPLVAANSHGVLVSRFVDDQELSELGRSGAVVERLSSRLTAVGNLLAVNDYGGIASPWLNDEEIKQAERVLGVKLRKATVGGYGQVGSMCFVTNSAALVHPEASEEELKLIKDALGVDVDLGTINGGVPFVSSGIIGNTRGLVVGRLTTGPELMILSRTFKITESPIKHFKLTS